MSVPKSEFSEEFIQRMRNAMEVSYYKYGPIKKGFPHKVSAVKEIQHRLNLYLETGNGDYLTDVATNYAMIESMLPEHSSYHYEPKDGGEGRVWHKGGKKTLRNDGERQ